MNVTELIAYVNQHKALKKSHGFVMKAFFAVIAPRLPSIRDPERQEGLVCRGPLKSCGLFFGFFVVLSRVGRLMSGSPK